MAPTTRTAHSGDLRRDSTPAEQRLWGLMLGRALGGCKFRRQQPLGPYTADFYCAQAKFVIEVDGGGHALTIEHDKERSDFFAETGNRALRFWNGDVMRNPEGVCAYPVETGDPLTSILSREGGGRKSGLADLG
jgi:very-short-patch-repair endonuclease